MMHTEYCQEGHSRFWEASKAKLWPKYRVRSGKEELSDNGEQLWKTL